MKLTHEQKNTVKRWAEEGAGLSEIQTRLLDEFSIRLSYMETRFLVIDLDATIKDAPSQEETQPQAVLADAAADAIGEDVADDEIETEALPAEGEVSVDINPITRPGFAVAGTVVFSDGIKGDWGVTVDGRLSLDPAQPDYRPTSEDLRQFQLKLRDLFASQGMG